MKGKTPVKLIPRKIKETENGGPGIRGLCWNRKECKQEMIESSGKRAESRSAFKKGGRFQKKKQLNRRKIRARAGGVIGPAQCTAENQRSLRKKMGKIE